MIIGIDEVGRGPLAGPVVVAAVALPSQYRVSSLRFKNMIIPLRDSKQLTAPQREEWVAWIKRNSAIQYAIARCTPKTIDAINITRAANRAAYAAYKKLNNKLITKNHALKTRILLDGGLHLPKRIPHTAIVKGDEKIPAIALASIIAKVTRDRYMEKKHDAWPRYHFNAHKGYGTAAHLSAIKRHGPCPLHRLTFITKFVMMKSHGWRTSKTP